MSAQVERHPGADDQRPRIPVRCRVGGAAIALGLVLVGMATVGLFTASTFAWVNRLLDPTILLLTAATACVSLGLYWPMREAWQRLLVLSVCLLVWVVWAVMAWMIGPILDEETLVVMSAPAGPGDDYEVVVREATDGWIDPAWALSIRQRDGLLAREWALGCISGDAPKDAYVDVTWDARGRLQITTQSRTVIVAVDPDSGDPVPRAGYPFNTC